MTDAILAAATQQQVEDICRDPHAWANRFVEQVNLAKNAGMPLEPYRHHLSLVLAALVAWVEGRPVEDYSRSTPA